MIYERCCVLDMQIELTCCYEKVANGEGLGLVSVPMPALAATELWKGLEGEKGAF